MMATTALYPSERHDDRELTRIASIFLWEWFTTKPYVDSGEVRFIGHVDSESSLSPYDTSPRPGTLILPKATGHTDQQPPGRRGASLRPTPPLPPKSKRSSRPFSLS